MSIRILGSIAMISIAGSAMGSVINANDMMNRVSQFQSPSGGWLIQIDISGLSTIDAFGDPDNNFFSLIHLPKEPDEPSIPNANTLLGIGWDLSLTTIGASWASDTAINFGGEFDIAFSTDSFPVTNQFYSSGGIIDLVDAGISPVSFGEDEYAMRVEFFETFDDTQNTAEAFFEEGSVLTLRTLHPATFAIPSPGPGSALCLAGLVVFKRRR